jgi:lipoate-protein ligase A
MSRRDLIHRLVEEVAEYISELEDKYGLTDKEIIQILEAVKQNYEWED